MILFVVVEKYLVNTRAVEGQNISFVRKRFFQFAVVGSTCTFRNNTLAACLQINFLSLLNPTLNLSCFEIQYQPTNGHLTLNFDKKE